MSATAPSSSEVRLRPADTNDIEITHAWQCEPGARRYFRAPKAPDRSEHEAWFRQRLNRTEPALWIIERSGQPVGVVRLDPYGTAGGAQHEVSLLIATSQRGRGIGTQALEQLHAAFPDYHLVASIAPENKSSVASFTRAGFWQSAPGFYESSPLSDGQTE